MRDVQAGWFPTRREFAARLLKALLALAAIAFALPTSAGEVHVMISGGFNAAYEKLAPQFEQWTGIKVDTVSGPSMGATPQAIPNRLDRGEPADVVIMAGDAIDGLIARGKVLAGSRVDLARVRIAMAVKQGDPKPDISTMEAFRKTLLDAKSIAHSDSASGVYLSSTLFPRMGIWEQIKDKTRKIPAEPVGRVVARGEAQIGFQPLSELMPIQGIDIVGLIPEEAQKVIVFSAGISAGAREMEGAHELIKYLSSDAVRGQIEKTGMEPVATGKNAY